jgi:hypothetical protein
VLQPAYTVAIGRRDSARPKPKGRMTPPGADPSRPAHRRVGGVPSCFARDVGLDVSVLHDIPAGPFPRTCPSRCLRRHVGFPCKETVPPAPGLRRYPFSLARRADRRQVPATGGPKVRGQANLTVVNARWRVSGRVDV